MRSGESKRQKLIDYNGNLANSSVDDEGFLPFKAAARTALLDAPNDVIIGRFTLRSEEFSERNYLNKSDFVITITILSSGELLQEPNDHENICFELDVTEAEDKIEQEDMSFIFYRSTTNLAISDCGAAISCTVHPDSVVDISTPSRKLENLLLQAFRDENLGNDVNLESKIRWFPKRQVGTLRLTNDASYAMLISSDAMVLNAVANDPLFLDALAQGSDACDVIDSSLIKWFLILDKESHEACPIFIQLASTASSRIAFIDIQNQSTSANNIPKLLAWLLLHPQGIRRGIMGIGMEVETLLSMSKQPLFVFQLEMDSGEQMLDVLRIRNLYSIHISGIARSARVDELDSLDLCVVVLENCHARENGISNTSSIQLFPSKDILVSGQLRKLFKRNDFKKLLSKEGDVLDFAIDHRVELCFMTTGFFTVYLVWRENKSAEARQIDTSDDRIGCKQIKEEGCLDSQIYATSMALCEIVI